MAVEFCFNCVTVESTVVRDKNSEVLRAEGVP